MKRKAMDMSGRDEPNNTRAICTRSRPCRRWRVCIFCARRRQAKIADAVERLASKTGQLRWNILYPSIVGTKGITTMRENWLQAANPQGAIWTIEQSRKTGAFHCNIITPAGSFHEPATGHIWTQTISGNPRHVGAYIAKPSQAPQPADYPGRLMGTAGPLWQYLTTGDALPIVAAAAAQHTIDRETMLAESVQQIEYAREQIRLAGLNAGQQQREKWAREEAAERKTTTKSLDDYRAIAARWLPDVLAITAKHQN